MPEPEAYSLSPSEVAEMLNVSPSTVTRWARQDRIPSIFTPGGHHRFRQSDVDRFRYGVTTERNTTDATH